MKITARLLAGLSTKEKPELMAPLAAAMNEFFPIFEINTEPRIECFLAQALHEADGFRTLQEYASGAAYDTRTDLGNTPQKDGDGQKFKGHGVFQTTGKTNHLRAQKEMAKYGVIVDLMNHPQLLTQPRNAVLSACIYWKDKKLNALADQNTMAAFKAITRKINGGYNGLADRIAYWEKCKKAIIEDAKPVGLINAGSSPEQIRMLQQALSDRNYPVGKIDGKWGRMTRDAVMSFKADNFLDVTDPSLSLTDVMMAGPKVIPTRVNATVADLREEGSTTVAGADKLQIAGIGGTVVAAGSSALSSFEEASSYWQRLRWAWEPFSDTFGWLLTNPLIFVLPIAIAAIYYGYRIKQKRLEEFKQGKVQ